MAWLFCLQTGMTMSDAAQVPKIFTPYKIGKRLGWISHPLPESIELLRFLRAILELQVVSDG